MPIIRLTTPPLTYISVNNSMLSPIEYLVDACPIVYLQYTVATVTTIGRKFYFQNGDYEINDIDYTKPVELIYCGKEKMTKRSIDLDKDNTRNLIWTYFRDILLDDNISLGNIPWELSLNENVTPLNPTEQSLDVICYDEIEIIQEGESIIVYDHNITYNKILVNIYNQNGAKITSRFLNNDTLAINHICWSLDAPSPIIDCFPIKECSAKDDIFQLADYLSNQTMSDQTWFSKIKTMLSKNGEGILTYFLKDTKGLKYVSIIRHDDYANITGPKYYEVYRYSDPNQVSKPQESYVVGPEDYSNAIAEYLTAQLLNLAEEAQSINDMASAFGIPTIHQITQEDTYSYLRRMK